MNLQFERPSLQQLSLMSVASYIVGRYFVLSLSEDSEWRIMRQDWNWRRISKLIGKKMDAYVLPGRLKMKLNELVAEMWIHVDKTFCCWLCAMNEHNYPEFEKVAWQKLFFKITGELDLEKMHKEAFRRLTESKTSNLSKDFYLACHFCLEDIVVEVFEKMNDTERMNVCIDSNARSVLSMSAQYWHSLVCNGTDHLTMCETLFQDSIDAKRPYEVSYFWDKLNNTTKKKRAMECFHFAVRFKRSELMINVLPHVDEADIEDVHREFSYDILNCLLEWPFDALFLPALNTMWNCLSPHQCSMLFKKLIDKRCLCEPSRFRSHLHRFWHDWPLAVKQDLIRSREFPSFTYNFFQLLDVGDRETFRMLVHDVGEIFNFDDGTGIPREEGFSFRYYLR